MLNLKNIIFIAAIIFMFLMPVNISFSSNPDYDQINDSVDEHCEVTNDAATQTRGAADTRSNYQIAINNQILMPEQNASWNQSDWSGGPGQNEWSDDSKYYNSENINDSDSNGPLRLGDGEDLEAWLQLNDGYARRYRHRMVFAPIRNVFYTFGGVGSGGNVVNELYEYNPAMDTWTQRGQTGGPSARCSSLLVYDNKSNVLWVYGGRESSWNNRFNDLWFYNPDNDTWIQKSDGPYRTNDMAGVFNPATQQIIIWGGYIGGSEYATNQVWTYDIKTDNWTMMKNYTKRCYNDAVWCPKTNSMLAYGGASWWDSTNGFTFQDELNEYFPHNDTWTNRTATGNRVRPVVAWDTLNEKLIMHGGGDPGDINDTWVYDTDTDEWERKLDGPTPPRDYIDGDWDPIRNQLVTFGGLHDNWRRDEVWVYYPNHHGYESEGSLVSSVFEASTKVNLRSVSFGVSMPLPPGITDTSVKIQLASSNVSAADVKEYIGPAGTATSHFTDRMGQSTPDELDRCRYFAYKVNLSTHNNISSPELNWIQIDYYNYQGTYEYVSGKYQLSYQYGLPLRHVDWESIEPAGTGIDIYIRQAYGDTAIESKSWEKVTKGQTIFGYREGTSFQYKAVFSTSDRSTTP
ncbi:MAG: hypothetical protein JSV49_05815, partial [Thermoplasmata archaeon]